MRLRIIYEGVVDRPARRLQRNDLSSKWINPDDLYNDDVGGRCIRSQDNAVTTNRRKRK